jgi:hypothetical protein
LVNFTNRLYGVEREEGEEEGWFFSKKNVYILFSRGTFQPKKPSVFSSEMYRPEFIHAYNLSRSKLPIDSWAQIIGKNLPQFSSASSIYNPITIQVKMAGETNSPTGAVKMSVDATDANWYSKLLNVLESMTNKKISSVVNYLGNSIESLSPADLAKVGECDLIDSNKKTPLRLAEPVQPPMYMSHNKLGHLKKWWEEKRDGLAQKIAADLKGLNMSEIAAATKLDGPVQTTISKYLERNTLDGLTWNEFAKTYGNGMTDLTEMSKKLLDAVRAGLIANETQIRNYHANVGSEAALWRNPTSQVQTKYKDDQVMFQDILEDVMYHPLVGKEMVQGVLYGIESKMGTKTRGQSKPRGDTRAKNLDDSKHPIQSYYQDYHFPIHGKLPGHVMTKYNKNAGLIASNYPGDKKRAFDMFNLFSGRTIDCGCGKKKKEMKKKPEEMKERIGTQMPKLIPIGGEAQERRMPKLIPIGGEMKEERMPKLIPIGGEAQERRMPKLIPIGGEMKEERMPQMPKLIPIGGEAKEERMPQMPKLIPIGGEVKPQMPKLIPIGGKTQERIGTQMPKLIPINGKSQVPINAHPVQRSSDAKLNEPIWVDDAPNLMDFLQRKK